MLHTLMASDGLDFKPLEFSLGLAISQLHITFWISSTSYMTSMYSYWRLLHLRLVDEAAVRSRGDLSFGSFEGKSTLSFGRVLGFRVLEFRVLEF